MEVSQLLLHSDQDEVKELIKKALPFGGELWQTGGERHINYIQKCHFDECSSKFLIEVSCAEVINPNFDLYLRFRYREVMFRIPCSNYLFLNKNLLCQSPQNVMALPLRQGDRYLFPRNSMTSLTLRRGIRTLREIVFDLEVKMLDFSESGLGLFLSGRNRHIIRPGDICWIEAIDHMPLSNPLFGRIKHITPKGKHSSSDVRVGIQLQNALRGELFESLKKQCPFKLPA